MCSEDINLEGEGLSRFVFADGERYALRARAIHLWRIDLRRPLAESSLCVLSPGESERAARFVFERDRGRFQQAHVGVRQILSRYIKVAPDSIEFQWNEHGKPRVVCEGLLGFNLSHSDDVAVVAVGRFADIGVDIEVRRSQRDLFGVARSVFSNAEIAELSVLDGDALLTGFYNCWTRKEAYLKAIGVGLALAPSSVTVGISPDPRFVAVAGWNGSCQVATIAQDDRATVSLAVAGGWNELEFFELSAEQN
jgi:4'-phosphopantetheinyl transferase